jgi:soluble lytic murein transglycosylase-like protein
MAFSLSGLVCLAPRLADARVGAQRHVPSKGQLARLERYDSYIRYYASLTYGKDSAPVPANYLRALVLGESSAQSTATSHKGARGLTQIMPQTGREAVAGLLELDRDFYFVERERLEKFDPIDLYDPAVNLLIAAYLTATYHHRYDGSPKLVTAAWNAGPHAVKRYGNRTPPYRETHQLINRVSSYMTYFQSTRFAIASVHRWDTSGWSAPGWDRSFHSPF